MAYTPLFVAITSALINWISVEKKQKTLEYITKPATMLALLWWIWSSVGLGGSMIWFTVGVVFCLAGDIFLMLPRDMFLFGLVAFLLGHISYTVGFNNLGPFINLWGVVLVLGLGLYIAWLFPKLAAGLKTKGKSNLKIPVLIYSLVISLMVYSACMTWTRQGWSSYSALAVSVGALFFYASDSILAWDRFVTPISHGRLKTMITYHMGQFGIILGAILHLTLK